LVWAGNPAHTNDARRSLKLRQIAPILANPGVAFVSLQTPVPAADQSDLSAATNVIDLAAELGNFSDTAAIIAGLDLIITVDTAVAHLAGAMGKPVWVLVSEPADWRWLRHREDSPWYPTLRIFRQPRPGAWDDAIKAVVIALNMEIRLQGSVR
jgi:ADP-heptose:LPS heptosyltransferase